LLSTTPAKKSVLAQHITPRGVALDSYLSRLVPAGFSGSVLVADSAGILLHKGYGWADLRNERTVTPTTIFSIGSLTKQFTAAGVLLLESRGKLSLQDTLGRFFPDAPADKQPITIHQLLSHTSGLRFGVIPENTQLAREEVTDRILISTLSFPPGMRFGYSNDGYKLLAAIIEIASGMTYRQFLQSSLFAPLGMRSTGFTQDPIEDSSRIARAYNEWKDLGSWESWSKGWPNGSGNVVSTTGDLHTWFKALESGSALPLPHARKMFTPQAAVSESRSYGYGFYLVTSNDSEEVALHGGDTRGYHCEVRRYKDLSLLIIILTNVELYDESGVGLGLHKRVIASNLRRLVLGEVITQPPFAEGHSVPEAIQGRYLLPDGSSFQIGRFGPFISIGGKGQAALDCFLSPPDSTRARKDSLNRKSDQIIAAHAAEDSARFAALLSEDERFFLSFWPGEWPQFTEEFGAYISHEVYGTYPLPWDSHMSRTYVRLVFEKRSMDYQFTWSGNTLYETVWDVGKPYPLIYSLIPSSASEFAIFDMVTGGEAGFRWVPGEAASPAKLIFPGGISATKRAP
jgi:CubicO group peptidase (beta-lactamase class C family)